LFVYTQGQQGTPGPSGPTGVIGPTVSVQLYRLHLGFSMEVRTIIYE